MPRVLAVLAAFGLALAILATPASVDARPKPKPTPTPRPTPTVSPTPSPTASPTFVAGIDVSYHQGTIDWSRVAAAGKRFAFIRASAGTLTADTMYAANRSGARAAGLTIGSYHFANPDPAANDAANEASWFLQHATIASGDLLPVLDLEVANGLGSAALIAWTQTWLERVYGATGVRPVIYTNAGFWTSSMANTDWFAQQRLSSALGRPLDERVAAERPGGQLGRQRLAFLAVLEQRIGAGISRSGRPRSLQRQRDPGVGPGPLNRRWRAQKSRRPEKESTTNGRVAA